MTAQQQKIGDIEAAMKVNTIQCREVLLEAKNRLLAQLSPEGQTSLIMWIVGERVKVKAVIPRSDLDFFRTPR